MERLSKRTATSTGCGRSVPNCHAPRDACPSLEMRHRHRGFQGLARSRAAKGSTVPDDTAPWPADLGYRAFTAEWPTALWVPDLQYVATWAGFV